MNESRVLMLLEQILKLSVTGRNYAHNHFDQERFSAIQQQAVALYEVVSEAQIPFLQGVLQDTGYLTPKVGVNAVIRNAAGKLLLERRSDDHTWGLPGGWAEVGLSPEDNVIREVQEETGLEIRVTGILGVFSRMPSRESIHTSYHLVYGGEVTGGTLTPSPESDELDWKTMEEVDLWHKDHQIWL